MWPAIHKEPANQAIYDNFKHFFQAGKNKIKEAVELDEKTKHGGTAAQKVHTAELYKEGRTFFKQASCNIMDIPEKKRSEVREDREKMANLDRSAADRIRAICFELDSKNRQNISSNGRPASPAGISAVRPRMTPAKNSSNNKENEHTCSRANRCGAHQPQLTKKFELTNGKRVITSGSTKVTNQFASTSAHQQKVGVSRAALLKGVDKNIGEKLLDEILDKTGVKMDDVAGCESAKRALEEAVILPSLNPSLFSGLRQPVKGILLYGPPGNGKTLLAKAVASEANQTFFNISASSLTSKWVGDSEKTIRGLFQIARNSQPSIIFIDEIDSILCERSEKDAEVSRRMKTEFLVQFDGATSSAEDRILVIGATNRPYELDDAVLRRFPKRIMIGLPNREARAELILKTLTKHNMLTGLQKDDIRHIASVTNDFSNSDLVALCKEAAMIPIRSIDKSRLAQTDQSKLRYLKRSDFDEALKMIRPSTSEKILTKLKEFSKNCGC